MLLPSHRVDLRDRRLQIRLHPPVERLLQRIADGDELRVGEIRPAQDDALRPAVGNRQHWDADRAGAISQCQRQEADRRALPTGTAVLW